MKKYLFVILIATVFLLGSCALKKGNFKDQVKGENLLFKEKYEALNGTKYSYNGKDYSYSEIEIDENNNMVELAYNEVLDLIDKGTGILLFARPECPWCRKLMPILIKYTNEVDANVYYYNAVIDRNAGNLNYRNLVDIMYDYLPVDTYTQKETDANFDKNKHGIIQPMLFFIKNGKIVDYIHGYSHEYLQNDDDEKMYNLIKEKYEKLNI